MSDRYRQRGAIVCPPLPAFYNHPSSVDALVDQTIGRLLDLLRIDPERDLAPRWAGPDARR